jgi:hypothetical protein
MPASARLRSTARLIEFLSEAGDFDEPRMIRRSGLRLTKGVRVAWWGGQVGASGEEVSACRPKREELTWQGLLCGRGTCRCFISRQGLCRHPCIAGWKVRMDCRQLHSQRGQAHHTAGNCISHGRKPPSRPRISFSIFQGNRLLWA